MLTQLLDPPSILQPGARVSYTWWDLSILSVTVQVFAVARRRPHSLVSFIAGKLTDVPAGEAAAELPSLVVLPLPSVIRAALARIGPVQLAGGTLQDAVNTAVLLTVAQGEHLLSGIATCVCLRPEPWSGPLNRSC